MIEVRIEKDVECGTKGGFTLLLNTRISEICEFPHVSALLRNPYTRLQ